jgi:hypothetical protein
MIFMVLFFASQKSISRSRSIGFKNKNKTENYLEKWSTLKLIVLDKLDRWSCLVREWAFSASPTIEISVKSLLSNHKPAWW